MATDTYRNPLILSCNRTMPWKKVDPSGSITDGLKIVSYEQSREGHIGQVQSDGFQPVNEANFQAWQEIERQISRAREAVGTGRRSRLYYYMISNQMGIFLLARYSRMAPWRVFIHLFPYFFDRLSLPTLRRYADLFQVSPEVLKEGELKEPVYTFSRRP